MRTEQKQKQRLSQAWIYATAGFATLVVVFGLIFIFNIGNVRSALAGGTTTVTWEGKFSSDWNNAKNWIGNKLPDNGDNIAITDKYKFPPIISSNSTFSVYDLNISKGAELEVKADLEVSDDITITGAGTLVKASGGVLAIDDHIYLLDGGNFVNEGATVNLGDDISIETGVFQQSGSKSVVITDKNIELVGANAYFKLNGGSATVKGDFDFENNSNKALQRMVVTGGELEIQGATRFYKTSSGDETNQMVEVSGGHIVFNEVLRKGTGSTFPANLIFKVDGGEIDFMEDLVMDQYTPLNNLLGKANGLLSGGSSGGSGASSSSYSYDICEEESIKKWNRGTYKRKNTEQIWVEYKDVIYRMVTGVYWSKDHEPDQSPAYWEKYTCVDLCSVADEWDSDETYTRSKGGDEVYVLFKGNIYRLAENVWWSENHHPDESGSKYWEYLGKCYDYTEPKCGTVEIWNSTKEYRRANQSEKIEVSYGGYKYTLKTNVWYSKNDKPSNSPSVWDLGDKCPGTGGSTTTTGEDALYHNDGVINFYKKWIRPDGFASKGDGVIHFLMQSDTMSLKAGEKYINLIIDQGAMIKLEGDVEVSGNLTNHSVFKPSGSHKILLNGTGTQKIGGNQKFKIGELEIDKATGKVYLDQHMAISGKLIISDGIIIESREIGGNKASEEAVLTFEDDATWEGGGWVEGKVRKIGDDAFTFPIGKDGREGLLSISAPASNTTYDAEYFVTPYSNVTSLGGGLVNVSRNEYWSLEQITGSGAVDVTLHWADGTWSNISDETELLVTSWSGTQWETLGHGSHTGNASSGTVTNQTAPSSYNFFTFGSNSNMANALPVELLYLRADRQGADVTVTWATAEEINNDYFELQRSTDGVYYEIIATVKGMGTYSGQKSYSFTDMDAPEIMTYYRLKQVDISGDFEYKGGVVSVLPAGEVSEQTPLEITSLGPNPFVNEITMTFKTGISGNCQLLMVNSSGNVVHEQIINAFEGDNTVRLNGGHLNQDFYIIRLMQGNKSATEKIIKSR